MSGESSGGKTAASDVQLKVANALPEDSTEPQVEYHPLGPNHTIRVSGVAYFYEPADDLWHRGSCPTPLWHLPFSITAETIHDWTLTGTAHITTWGAKQ